MREKWQETCWDLESRLSVVRGVNSDQSGQRREQRESTFEKVRYRGHGLKETGAGDSFVRAQATVALFYGKGQDSAEEKT